MFEVVIIVLRFRSRFVLLFSRFILHFISFRFRSPLHSTYVDVLHRCRLLGTLPIAHHALYASHPTRDTPVLQLKLQLTVVAAVTCLLPAVTHVCIQVYSSPTCVLQLQRDVYQLRTTHDERWYLAEADRSSSTSDDRQSVRGGCVAQLKIMSTPSHGSTLR